MLVERLGQSVLTLDAAARALAVSRRTLIRRLAEEGASFRLILDDVRPSASFSMTCVVISRVPCFRIAA